ncbi:MAG TPA: hypothetical protein VHI52_11345 [Verrucomicrobiae bacterium]|nr:hypothetical protein [Verrucomicrobiae bacterium]
MAILKQHLQRLFFACTRDGDLGAGTNSFSKEVPQARPGAKRNDCKPLARLRFEADENAGADSACQSLSEFREDVRSLYRESLEDVMLLQFKHRSWNSFLDSYLELLALRPTQIDPVIWGPGALAASRICGRTNEVLDAMGHFIRFSKDDRTVTRFQALIRDWAAGRLEDRTRYF